MAPEPRRPTLPQTIGRYKIVGRLGKGAMGVVYSAVDEIMERPVAIKVMMADLEEDPETSARFYREARAAGQLAHRNVITIYDMGEDGGRPFIVMELVEGHQLADYLKRPETSALELKVDLMMQICEGLRAAHAHGIFHRDVKPGNLVVRADGALKILDFGIARLASSNMTASGLIVGTPDYMAPEQARGQEVDQRSDIFSAGAVFYFILTGRKPFAASDLRAVLNKVERDDPLPIRDTEAPEALSRIVMKALSKAPAARHQSCGELVADLTQFKRVFDAETRQMAEDARQKLAVIDALVVERHGLAMRVTPDATTPSDEEIREELLRRSPGFSAWLSGAIVVEPFRRATMLELHAEMARTHQALAAEVASLRTADVALTAGARAVEAGDTQAALAAFEKAIQAVPGCQRARIEADRCRRILEELQGKREEARALVVEAKKSAALAQWGAVVALCEKALTLDRSAAEASTLRTQAAKALDVEVRERRRAEQTAAEREEALKHAKAAEAALDNSEPERALDLSKKALATDPGLTLARRVHGQASARISALAEAKARAASAVERLRDAKLLLAKGKYKKAREMVAAATALDPKNVEAARALAEIDAEEARVIAERERAQLAEDRARAIAPMLEMARAAEADRDFVRAAWTAENIMAIDLECAEARAILKRARDTIAAQPALADETVDALRSQRDASDPEGTVTLTRITPWRRFLDVLRSIAGGSRRRSKTPPAMAQPVTRADRSGKGV